MNDRRMPGAYFGEAWPAGVCDDGHQVPTPVGEPCSWCDELIGDTDQGSFWNGGALAVHRECSLRSVIGGIGHIENHPYWCELMHDPDGGRPKRQSSLEVWAWVHEHGVPPLAAMSELDQGHIRRAWDQSRASGLFLHGWTIYDHPTDFSEHFVVREWRVGVGGRRDHSPIATTFDSVGEARDSLPPGLTCLPREPGDDPVIVESWL